MIPAQKNMRAQAGFTLVELAIVMIIIGLLIAGVLKGQALIHKRAGDSNCGADQGHGSGPDRKSGSLDNALPGDVITTPQTKLPTCLCFTISCRW